MAKSKVTIDDKNNDELELKSSATRKSSTPAKNTVAKKSSSVSKSNIVKASTSDKSTGTKKTTSSAKSTTEKNAGQTAKSSTTKKASVAVKSTTTKKAVKSAKSADEKESSLITKSKTVKANTSTKSTGVKKSTTSAKSADENEAVDTVKVKATKKSDTTAKSASTKKSTKKATNKVSIKSLLSKRISSRKKSKSDKNDKKLINSLNRDINSIDDEEDEKFVDIPEYYDLPYKYEKTVVKVLYQNPTTLFVYWDVSDDDINGFKKAYGDNFFYVTKPVLVIHNITDGYSFEIEVNDFANNWYIHVSDAKCKYNVELGRRPSQSAKIENLAEHRMDEFINVSYSNTVEMPNDHILFFKDNDKIYFKNIKTNKVTEKVINLKRDSKHIKPIYAKYDLTENEDRFDFNNPSSQNPTSNVM